MNLFNWVADLIFEDNVIHMTRDTFEAMLIIF